MGVLTAIAAMSAIPSRAAPWASIVTDARTGEVLQSTNADTRLHPASLTKMLTLYIAFEAIQRGEITLDTMVTVSKHAASQPPSRLGLRAGQRIAMRHLIRAAAIKSANDAATAIGDAISGNEARFSERMNRTARALGMTKSTFKNAHGLTQAGHLSTARDMNLLGRRLFYDFPQYYNIFSRRSTDAGIAQVNNTNRRFLDAYRGADGIKTGYTNAAGFNLTASAERGNKRIIATVFGGKSTAHRNAEMAKLMDIGFGAAPNRAPVQKPPPPDYSGAALVAEVEGDDTSKAISTGKTVRVSTLVTTSPRPRARPAAVDPAKLAATEASVLAMQGAIDDVVAMATGAAAAPADPAPAPAPAAEPLPFAVVEATPPADAAAAAADAAAQMALAAAAPETPAVPAVRPPPRPAAEAAEAAPATPDVAMAEAQAPDLPFEVVEVAPAAEDTLALAEAPPAPLQAAIVPLMARAAPLAVDTGAAAPSATTFDLAAMAAAPAPEPVRVRSQPKPVEPEVVTRISTSGGRHWGVSLGTFPSRAAAERTLMRTALSDSVTLGDGLRKIVNRSSGFEANVMGLTQEQADLACRRIQARAGTCFTVGP
jgi:D-alanyl-D-alanine carboxypeptidase